MAGTWRQYLAIKSERTRKWILVSRFLKLIYAVEILVWGFELQRQVMAVITEGLISWLSSFAPSQI